MTELSPEQQEVAEQTVCVLLVRGENPDGESIYAYVAVRVDKLEEFMAAQASGAFHPEDYGVIIEAGEGEPSLAVRRKMETEYGFNHDKMVDIPDAEAGKSVADNLDLSKAEFED